MAVSETRAEVTPQSLPNILHLGCGDDYRDGEHNVDAVASVGPDEQVDLDEIPWPWPDESFRLIRAYHVFEHLNDIEAALGECIRVLQPGGKIDLRLPAGVNADADPDHTWGTSGRPWTWQTPEFYTGKRHWDSDLPLQLSERAVELHTHYSHPLLQALHHLKWRLERWWDGDGEWCFRQPAASGEFRVVFVKNYYRTPWNV